MMDVDMVAREIHRTAVDHGFWDKDRNLGEMLMLVASELAECLEEDRAGEPLVYWKCKFCGFKTTDPDSPDMSAHPIPFEGVAGYLMSLGQKLRYYCPEPAMKPEGALVEIVDAIIRLKDTGHDMANRTHKYTLSQVMDIKMSYNAGREFMHGKAY